MHRHPLARGLLAAAAMLRSLVGFSPRAESTEERPPPKETTPDTESTSADGPAHDDSWPLFMGRLNERIRARLGEFVHETGAPDPRAHQPLLSGKGTGKFPPWFDVYNFYRNPPDGSLWIREDKDRHVFRLEHGPEILLRPVYSPGNPFPKPLRWSDTLDEWRFLGLAKESILSTGGLWLCTSGKEGLATYSARRGLLVRGRVYEIFGAHVGFVQMRDVSGKDNKLLEMAIDDLTALCCARCVGMTIRAQAAQEVMAAFLTAAAEEKTTVTLEKTGDVESGKVALEDFAQEAVSPHEAVVRLGAPPLPAADTAPDNHWLPVTFLAETGLLIEVNRLVLNPLGLMLVVDGDRAKGLRIAVRDERQDPEGLAYDEATLRAGAEALAKYMSEHGGILETRAARLGYTVQPTVSTTTAALDLYGSDTDVLGRLGDSLHQELLHDKTFGDGRKLHDAGRERLRVLAAEAVDFVWFVAHGKYQHDASSLGDGFKHLARDLVLDVTVSLLVLRHMPGAGPLQMERSSRLLASVYDRLHGVSKAAG